MNRASWDAACARIADLEARLAAAERERDTAQVVAFVRGAQWWEYEKTGATMWQSDRNKAEEVALARYDAANPAPEDR